MEDQDWKPDITKLESELIISDVEEDEECSTVFRDQNQLHVPAFAESSSFLTIAESVSIHAPISIDEDLETKDEEPEVTKEVIFFPKSSTRMAIYRQPDNLTMWEKVETENSISKNPVSLLTPEKLNFTNDKSPLRAVKSEPSEFQDDLLTGPIRRMTNGDSSPLKVAKCVQSHIDELKKILRTEGSASTGNDTDSFSGTSNDKVTWQSSNIHYDRSIKLIDVSVALTNIFFKNKHQEVIDKPRSQRSRKRHYEKCSQRFTKPGPQGSSELTIGSSAKQNLLVYPGRIDLNPVRSSSGILPSMSGNHNVLDLITQSKVEPMEDETPTSDFIVDNERHFFSDVDRSSSENMSLPSQEVRIKLEDEIIENNPFNEETKAINSTEVSVAKTEVLLHNSLRCTPNSGKGDVHQNTPIYSTETIQNSVAEAEDYVFFDASMPPASKQCSSVFPVEFDSKTCPASQSDETFFIYLDISNSCRNFEQSRKEISDPNTLHVKTVDCRTPGTDSLESSCSSANNRQTVLNSEPAFSSSTQCSASSGNDSDISSKDELSGKLNELLGAYANSPFASKDCLQQLYKELNLKGFKVKEINVSKTRSDKNLFACQHCPAKFIVKEHLKIHSKLAKHDNRPYVKVLAELNRLLTKVRLKLPLYENFKSCMFTIYYHNLGLFENDLRNIVNEPLYGLPDVYILSLVNLQVSSRLQFSGYQIAFQSNTSKNSKFGITVGLTKKDCFIYKNCIRFFQDTCLSLHLFKTNNVFIITGYASPNFQVAAFRHKMSRLLQQIPVNSPIIVIGDFSYDVQIATEKEILDSAIGKTHNLHSVLPIEPKTAKNESCLSVIYTNVQSYNADIYFKKFYSNHFPIFIQIPLS